MRGWLTPDILTPDVAHVRRLLIPGDKYVLAAVSGALVDLTYPYNWEAQGAATPDETAQAMSVMYQRFTQEIWSMIGAIVPCVTASTPVGCLECDGATYDGVDYPDLYAVIDAAWKGAGTVFVVPDLRGKFPLGMSVGHAMAGSGGQESVALVESEIPGHTHSTGNSLTGAALMPGEGPVLVPNPLPASTGSTGGNGSHENMPPFVAVRYVLIAR